MNCTQLCQQRILLKIPGLFSWFYAVKTRDLRNSKRGRAYPPTYFILQE